MAIWKVYRHIKKIMEFEKRYIFFIAILMMLLLSCNKEDEHPVPNVPVEYHTNVLHHNLNNPGMSAQITGHGYRGLFIYRLSMTEVRAYDRACPEDPACTLNISDSSAELVESSCCASTYILTDGSPVQNHSGYPLRKYRCFFDSESGRLTVRN